MLDLEDIDWGINHVMYQLELPYVCVCHFKIFTLEMHDRILHKPYSTWIFKQCNFTLYVIK